MKFHLYQYKALFKMGLFVFALLMMVMLFFYVERMVSDLREENRAILETYANVYAKVGSEDISEFRFFFEEIIQKTTFPLIITDAVTGEPAQWQGIGISYFDRSEGNLKKIRKLVEKMKKESKPVPLYYKNVLFQYIHYGDTQLIKSLGMLPYVGVLAVALFVLIGFIGFNNIRRSEQRFLWVGMAKETAHQLGTPISSLMGWHEILKYSDKSQREKVLEEFGNDINRLKTIANRFSNIGSIPELKPEDIRPHIKHAISYIRKRTPQLGKDVQIIEQYEDGAIVNLNEDLFEWVIENLLKNALDVIKNKDGRITASVSMSKKRKNQVYIDITDNGKGIPKKYWKEIFKPGFSTKKRGWGLGLTLAKRIIEEYHNGKLFVKESVMDQGTTMRIVLSNK